jgi:hypothetical protein
MIVRDARVAIAATAEWLVKHKAGDVYSEGSQRMSAIGRRFVVPIVADCSAFVTVCYNWAGAPDPNGLRFDHEGFTGTLLSAGEHLALFRKNAKHVEVEDVLPGDVIVYGPGSGVHAVLIVGRGDGNPYVASHGHPGDPGIYRNSELLFLGEPTYLRFQTRTRGKIHYPPGYKKSKKPND